LSLRSKPLVGDRLGSFSRTCSKRLGVLGPRRLSANYIVAALHPSGAIIRSVSRAPAASGSAF